MATQDEVRYKRPPHKKESDNALKSGKFCRFHESHGHDTNECHHLRDLIEEHIRRRRLERYVKGQNRTPTPANENPKQPLPEVGGGNRNNHNTSGSSQEKIVVLTISGGPHIADRSWQRWKGTASRLEMQKAMLTPSRKNATRNEKRTTTSYSVGVIWKEDGTHIWILWSSLPGSVQLKFFGF